jgi:hypothetical protein
MDLGLKWLMYDFHPASNERNPEKEWRMLILDGHNSHCSYAFVDFCEKHQIVLLCLPSHTTHCLQPCNIGVFGPLASCWKAEVNKASRKNIAIMKYNLPEIYSQARDRAFTQTTIQSAFRKTGIYPFDPSMIEETAFSPALNMTMQAAQPVPTSLPTLLIEVATKNTPPSSMASRHIHHIHIVNQHHQNGQQHRPYHQLTTSTSLRCIHTSGFPISFTIECIYEGLPGTELHSVCRSGN